MKRPIALLSLALFGCRTMEPAYVRPDLAILSSWPVGDPYLRQSEAALPSVTYEQVFQDPRLQTLIRQALANNRDLMVAAANIAAAREQYNIQRAQQFPQLDATGGATVTGRRSSSSSSNSGSESSNSGLSAQYQAGLSVPSYEIDLFGRMRSLSHVELNRYFATEAAARATRLTMIGDIARAWLQLAADESLLLIAQETAASAEKSVRLTRLRLEGGIAPRTDLSQAEQILDQAQADVAQSRTTLAQDVNLLQLLVGAPIDPSLLSNSIDQAAGTIASPPAGLDSYVLLRRPNVVQAEYELRAANAQIGVARAALFPRISLTGLAGFASSALLKLLTGGAFGFSLGANANYTIFQAGAGQANVRLTEAQKAAAVATYQHAVQAAFREVADALARRGTLDDEISARARQKAAAADVYLLTEARYREGIDPYLNVLDAQRSYYAAQRTLVQIKLASAQNGADLYQSLGGDTF